MIADDYIHFQTGGEMYFSDIYSSKPVPESLRENKVLWGEHVTKPSTKEEGYLVQSMADV